MCLPMGRARDEWGGWTLAAPQRWWSHPAEKASLFYIVGVPPASIPPLPFSLSPPTHQVTHTRRDRPSAERRNRTMPNLSRAAREKTPPLLASWLVSLARSAALEPAS
jgi:hypothetical protein